MENPSGNFFTNCSLFYQKEFLYLNFKKILSYVAYFQFFECTKFYPCHRCLGLGRNWAFCFREISQFWETNSVPKWDQKKTTPPPKTKKSSWINHFEVKNWNVPFWKCQNRKFQPYHNFFFILSSKWNFVDIDMFLQNVQLLTYQHFRMENGSIGKIPTSARGVPTKWLLLCRGAEFMFTSLAQKDRLAYNYRGPKPEVFCHHQEQDSLVW